MPNDTAVLRLKRDNSIYRHIEGDKYLNLKTKKEWEIPPEKAREIFEIDMAASWMINENPILEELIFNLKMIIVK